MDLLKPGIEVVIDCDNVRLLLLVKRLFGGIPFLPEAVQSIVWLFAVTIIPAAIVSAATLYPVRSYASRLGLLDHPGGHSTHQRATPLGGGIGIWLGIMATFAAGTLAVLVARESEELQQRLPAQIQPYLEGAWLRIRQIWSLLGCGTILFGLGLIDDRTGVNHWLRLAIQFSVAAFVVLWLGFGLTAYIANPWITNVMSIVWIVGVINSFNMLDNMDGLSGGVAAIIASSMGVVMLTTPDPGTIRPQLFVASLLFVVTGSLFGFLWHNRPPAKIFMGDGGSYLVGFLIAVAMLMATFAGRSDRPHAVLAPLCAMAVPLYDMTTVLWIRIREGRSPFMGDRSHFSHRLVELGLSRTQAVLTIYLVTATCGLAAVLLTHVSIVQAIAVLAIVACMLLLIVILESTGWRKNRE